jgi:diguanylate cyclase
VARYGGEEFVLLLPGLGVEEARELLMKVQRELTRDVYLYDSRKVFMTFSAGATLVRPDDSLESALLRADEAMYQAKNAGKNCVAVS